MHIPFTFLVVIGMASAVLWLMLPRRFYIIRHGETVLNAKRVRQGEEGELSERGREQAEIVGRALAHHKIGRIIASDYLRAKETANIINNHLRVPVIFSHLLAERRNPSEVIGKYRDDPEVARITDQMDLSYHDDGYRFSDEENFSDLKLRAKKCLALLARQNARETCVITHHVFLKVLLSYMLYRDRLHASDFAKLAFFNFSDNATITVCEYRPWEMFGKTRGWKVIAFNENP